MSSYEQKPGGKEVFPKGALAKGSTFHSYLSDLLKKRAEMLTRRDRARATRSCGGPKKCSTFSDERLTKLAFKKASCSGLSFCMESGVELELLLVGEVPASSTPSTTSCRNK